MAAQNSSELLRNGSDYAAALRSRDRESAPKRAIPTFVEDLQKIINFKATKKTGLHK
jgi:hypothetical protein